ncbi:MAG: hypothetical protein GTO02_03060, partial [Candidatus Dadabacteria bacterium]|nr:hypothetical protein [Candidatus Dadabacteria bacterium]NIQ13409.1 hypothetical protein [Candidatus Dadabacteria bacterium]
MKYNLFVFIFIFIFFSDIRYSNSKIIPKNSITVEDWSFYGTWGAVAIIHSLKIKNNSNKKYKNLKVRICYSSISSNGNIISTQTGILNIEIPAMSEKIYLREGITLGAGA